MRVVYAAPLSYTFAVKVVPEISKTFSPQRPVFPAGGLSAVAGARAAAEKKRMCGVPPAACRHFDPVSRVYFSWGGGKCVCVCVYVCARQSEKWKEGAPRTPAFWCDCVCVCVCARDCVCVSVCKIAGILLLGKSVFVFGANLCTQHQQHQQQPQPQQHPK